MYGLALFIGVDFSHFRSNYLISRLFKNPNDKNVIDKWTKWIPNCFDETSHQGCSQPKNQGMAQISTESLKWFY